LGFSGLDEMSGAFSGSLAPAIEEPRIDGQVYNKHKTGKKELDCRGEAWRIDEIQKIVFDKTLCVTGLTCLNPKIVLQIGEWAYPSGQFNKNSPSGCRKVHKWDPAPPQPHSTTCKGKKNEGQMEQEHAIGS
jgi:hypothetical protein